MTIVCNIPYAQYLRTFMEVIREEGIGLQRIKDALNITVELTGIALPLYEIRFGITQRGKLFEVRDDSTKLSRRNMRGR